MDKNLYFTDCFAALTGTWSPMTQQEDDTAENGLLRCARGDMVPYDAAENESLRCARGDMVPYDNFEKEKKNEHLRIKKH